MFKLELERVDGDLKAGSYALVDGEPEDDLLVCGCDAGNFNTAESGEE